MIVGFEPIIDENCEILILGSMPGVESLRKYEEFLGRESYSSMRCSQGM